MKNLNNPGKEYRPIPFWSWNDKLDPDLLKWQIGEMKKAGLGGYFMHARGGLETPYMGNHWMKCVAACIEEGKKLSIDSWLYDESGWPSGFAGGAVTALGDHYHGRWLQIREYCPEEKIEEASLIGIYKLNGGSKEIVITHASNPYYIDVMNPDAVKAFIDYTHERYYQLFAEDFGQGMKGFFTDEPRLSGSIEGDIPWSYLMPPKFNEKYGYDLLEVVPSLFFECPGYEKVRYDFWQLVSEMFVSAFMEQINQWCENHNCILTGHVMMEESIFTQMTGTAGVMPFYEHMGIPGIDWLRRMIASPVVPKQVSSVCNQLGKKFALTESFALSGWNVSFEELKWIAEWQYVNGVNLMCQHLEGYTLRGLRKRDYPPSLFIQQSWWEEYYRFNDYLARLGMILTSGRNVAHILMIHPMRSGWITYDGSQNEKIKKLDTDFVKASEMLSGLHVDYHYGDESIIGKYGSVEGDLFVVGQCKYRVVVLPSMATLDKNTIELLNLFIENGGKVISLGDFPSMCNGSLNTGIQLHQRGVISIRDNEESFYSLMKEMNIPTISITSTSENFGEIQEIHYQHRDLGDSQVFFMVNHNQEKTFKAHIAIRGKGRVRKLDAETARVEKINYIQMDGSTKVDIDFLPMQSHVLIFDDEPETLKEQKNKLKEIELRMGQHWAIEEMDLNSLTLDYCSYSIDDGKWENPIPIIKLMDLLLKSQKSCDIALKFNFEVDMDLEYNKQLFLVLETANEFEIHINDNKVEYKEEGWWKDTAFKKVDIKKYVKQGQNEIMLKRRFYQEQKVYDVLFGEDVYETEINQLTYAVELESIYLVGEFGVISKKGYVAGTRKSVFTDGPFIMVNRPKTVETGDLTSQGLCFFAGAIKLSQIIHVEKEKDSKIMLKLGQPDAAMIKIFVNDNFVKALLWAPYHVDVTDYVNEGDNKLTIQLFASNRNLLGPHHHLEGELHSVGPLSFAGKWSWVEKKTEAIPSTEEERERDYWKDGYSFVPFGLS